MVAGRERCHEEATRTAPVPAEPHGPRRCGGPEHSVGLSINSQEFFARFLRVAGLAAQPHGSSENASRKANETADEINRESLALDGAADVNHNNSDYRNRAGADASLPRKGGF